ncbi:MAG: metabolite traffic protein EboE [Planctomycetota bacterium]|nr:metabolite traffic protein EboE [Planctomycetota bacterium]
MRFENPDHPGRAVRLAYCLNLHPAEDLDGVLRGVREITLPLADELDPARDEGDFGLGAYLPGKVVLAMEGDDAEDRAAYVGFVAANGLDPFTYNAFPIGGFHHAGLKQGVFRPTWMETERQLFTWNVARVAADAWKACGARSRHVSISTHTGMYAADVGGPADLDACADGLARMARTLAEIEQASGCRIVLSLEPEPGSNAGDARALAGFHERIRARAREVLGAGSDTVLRRHLGTCLDACHAAVAFEHPQEAFLDATADGTPLGKLQFTSAISLRHPDGNDAGRERLFGLEEPVYLHQVTGRRGGDVAQAADLPEARRLWKSGAVGWRGCEEWRCHFHVPVDMGDLGDLGDGDRSGPAGGLGTTRAVADEILAVALSDPERWGTEELHVEIETYTWDVLPSEVRGTDSLVAGLAREYRHVLERMEAAGWTRARSGAAKSP